MGRKAPARARIPPSPLQGVTATLSARFTAPVAQLDRASVYGTEGQRFESSRARSGTRGTGFFAAASAGSADVVGDEFAGCARGGVEGPVPRCQQHVVALN